MVKIQTAQNGRQEGSLSTASSSPIPAIPRDGRFIEEIGTYDPCCLPRRDQASTLTAPSEWIKTGAQPTDTVRALLKKVDVL